MVRISVVREESIGGKKYDILKVRVGCLVMNYS